MKILRKRRAVSATFFSSAMKLLKAGAGFSLFKRRFFTALAPRRSGGFFAVFKPQSERPEGLRAALSSFAASFWFWRGRAPLLTESRRTESRRTESRRTESRRTASRRRASLRRNGPRPFRQALCSLLSIGAWTGGSAFASSEAGEPPLPPVTDYAAKLEILSRFLVIVSVIVCVLTVAAFVYFSLRYRRRSQDEIGSASVSHSALLEFVWSFIPFLIFAAAFVWGWILYHDLKRAPKDSLEIHVYGRMWSWDFVYKNGRKTVNALYVPKDRPVKLILTSKDVLHSFYIPAFRIKQDAVPGMYTSLWFKANRLGKFQVFCAEFCGTGHSAMTAKVNVLPLEEWEAWLDDDPFQGMTVAEIGEKTFQNRCLICHHLTKEKLTGPGLAGIFGAKREFSNAEPVTADDNYLRESILNPAAKIVKDYPNAMTPFAGALSEEELSGLIEYIKGLK